MKNHRRLYAGLLCVALVLLLFVSSAYIVCEARHACTGEACAICQQVLQARALIQRFALASAVLLLLFTAPLMEKALCAPWEWRGACWRTLVSWKIRLNN